MIQADAAAAWLRRMRQEGGDWEAAPEPSIDELRVDASADYQPREEAAALLLSQTKDLTQLYYVGVEKRREANRHGITRWTDPRVTPTIVGVGVWLLAVLRDLMDRRLALEHLAPYVIAGEPPPAEMGRAGRRLIAKETTRTRTLEEDVAILTGGSIADAPPRRTRPDD